MTIVCGECGEEFPSRQELFKHIRSEHGDESKSNSTHASSLTPQSVGSNRRDPRKMFEVEEPPPLEITNDEEEDKFDWEKLSGYLPVTLSVFWIFIGTVFYAAHDNLGWSRALLMSVNVGWSINWPMDGLSEFESPMSKFFTIYHTSIGVVFAGVTVLYMAQAVGKNKDNWILQIIKIKELDATAHTEGWWDSIQGLIKVHFPTIRVIAVFLVWLTFGLLWFPITNSEYSVSTNVDFVLSTLSAGGYVALPSTIKSYQLIFTALYANFGVPLLAIALGLLISAMMKNKDNLIFHQIIAPVTSEEISFMQEFCIENGDGVVDNGEFIILAIVRIGAASPELILRINDRFREMDRKHMGKIAYDDLVVDRVKPPPVVEQRVNIPAPSISQTSTLSSRRFSLSSKATSFMQSSNSLIKARAKNFVSGNSAAAEIRANIAKIESLRKSPSPTSSRKSSRITVQALHSVMNPGESDDDSDSNDDSTMHIPSWRNPKRRKSSIIIQGRDGEETRVCGGGSGRYSNGGSARYSNGGSGRYSNGGSGRYSNGGSGRISGKYVPDEEDNDKPKSWRNPRRKNSKINGMNDDSENDNSGHSTASIVSSSFPVECLSIRESDHEPLSHAAALQEAMSVFDNKEPSDVSVVKPMPVKPMPTESTLSSPRSSRKVYPLSSQDDAHYLDSSSSDSEEEREREDELEDLESCNGRQIPYTTTTTMTSVSSFGELGTEDGEGYHDEEMSSPQKSLKNKFREIVKKQQKANLEMFSFPKDDDDESAKSSGKSSKSSTKSKHHHKLQKAIEERRSSKREAFQIRRKSRWEKMKFRMKKRLKSSHAIKFYLWFLWLTIGTIFYSLEENLTVCQGIFVSTSIGYGIFWYDETSTNDYAKVFSTLHFSVGVFCVSYAMAVFARSLVSTQKEWFNEAKQKRQLQDGRVTYFEYYWPKVWVHVFFLIWMTIGIIWGMASIRWNFLDAWFFCMSLMTTGGFVSLPSSRVHEADYVFVSVYIIIGAPLMAISCGIYARSISNYGRSSKLETKLLAPVTEDELVMMKHLGIEDDDGFMDSAEFCLLVLVRIGALNADLISVLLDRFQEINVQGTVTYASLERGGSFVGSAMLMPVNSKKLPMGGSFNDNGKEAAIVKKLRLDSLGG